MPDAPPRGLIDAIAQGKALIVCGAGVSAAATGGVAPGWAKLIKDALEAAAKPGGGMAQAWVKGCAATLESEQTEDWLTAADTIQTKLGGANSGAYRAFFVERLGKLEATKPAIVEAIGRLHKAGARVATTNYDHLLSEASDLPHDRADWTNPTRVIEALRGERPAIWHIHGEFDNPQSIVFSQRDYERIVNKELPQFVQHSAGLDFTLVFVGCSGSGLADDNVGRLLDWLHQGFSGLGDEHFALTTDDNKDSWPRGVTVLRVGGRDDLPAWLERLAPAPTPRETFPPDPDMIGRQDRLQQLVRTILDEDRPVVIPGALGMGKTTLALAAAYDSRVVARFGAARRAFVRLDAAPDADALLGRLAASLGVSARGSAAEILARIATASAVEPWFVILDNVETPWRGDEKATEARLGELAAIPGLRLVLTARGEPPHLTGPGARVLKDVERHDEASARALFLRHAGDEFAADPALPGFLRDLDGHPLSIELLAANAAGLPDLRGLADDWSRRRVAMLKRGRADDRLTSLRVSVDISLDALGADSAAHRLLRLMAMLPDGLAAADARALLDDGPPTAEAAAAGGRLEQARLAFRRDGRWRLLAPIRELLAADFPPEPADRARLTRVFLDRMAKGDLAGTDRWDEAREMLEADADNLDAMLRAAARDAPPLAGIAAAAVGLAEFHRFTGRASITSLPQVASRLRDAGDLNGEANCIFWLGLIAHDRSKHDGARARYQEALPLYRQVGSLIGEANCIKSLGDIALERSDHDGARARYEEALPLYRKVGNRLGEANCISSLGDIALERSDPDSARARYEEALPLFRQVGSLLGEANCIQRLGGIARERSDHDDARARFEEALPLYRRCGSLLGEANCILRLGGIDEARRDLAAARERWSAALQLYEKIAAPYSIGAAHRRLARAAETPDEAAAQRTAARQAWASIGRQDLIDKWLGKDS